jgi:hypothetical protein
MLIIPQADPAKVWQMRADKGKEELFQLMANIVLYAVDKQGLQFKGQTHLVVPDPAAVAQGTIKVARLEYSGNWNPEPGGWRRLAAIFHNNKKTTLDAEPVKLGTGALKGFKIAHLTGTTKFRFEDAQRTEIKSFIAAGGTLVIDAAGGSAEFADSAEAELQNMFPAESAQLNDPLPVNHAVYALDGYKADDTGYRTFTRSKLTGSLKAPRLRGMTIGGRTAVIFSPEDISAGLVGNQIDGIIGYDPKTATELMKNIILYANGH